MNTFYKISQLTFVNPILSRVIKFFVDLEVIEMIETVLIRTQFHFSSKRFCKQLADLKESNLVSISTKNSEWNLFNT